MELCCAAASREFLTVLASRPPMRKFVKERSSFSGRHFARPHHAKVDFKPVNTSDRVFKQLQSDSGWISSL